MLSLCPNHISINYDNCLKTIFLKGNIERIKKFVKVALEYKDVKGIKMHYFCSSWYYDSD